MFSIGDDDVNDNAFLNIGIIMSILCFSLVWSFFSLSRSFCFSNSYWSIVIAELTPFTNPLQATVIEGMHLLLFLVCVMKLPNAVFTLWSSFWGHGDWQPWRTEQSQNSRRMLFKICTDIFSLEEVSMLYFYEILTFLMLHSTSRYNVDKCSQWLLQNKIATSLNKTPVIPLNMI